MELLEILYIFLIIAAGSYAARALTEIVFMIKDYQKDRDLEDAQKEH